MNFQSQMFFSLCYCNTAWLPWQDSAQSDVIRDGCGCLPLWALAVQRTSQARLIDLLKKVKTLLCQCELEEYESVYFIRASLHFIENVMGIGRSKIAIFHYCVYCKFVTVILFVPISQSFTKIERVVFELCAKVCE